MCSVASDCRPPLFLLKAAAVAAHWRVLLVFTVRGFFPFDRRRPPTDGKEQEERRGKSSKLNELNELNCCCCGRWRPFGCCCCTKKNVPRTTRECVWTPRAPAPASAMGTTISTEEEAASSSLSSAMVAHLFTRLLPLFPA